MITRVQEVNNYFMLLSIHVLVIITLKMYLFLVFSFLCVSHEI